MSVFYKHQFPELLLKFSYENPHSYTNKTGSQASAITNILTEH